LYFYYADEGLIGEFDVTGNSVRLYGYAPDTTWTTDPLYQKSSLGYGYYQNDHLGMPQQLIQKNGAKVWGGEFRAFGELTAETGAWENRLRFPGQYFDQETGNYYNYFRDYDPATGRYVQSDPIGLAGGINTYVYAQNNTAIYIDNYGLNTIKGRFLGVNINNVDVTSANFIENPYFADPDYGADSMTMGWVDYVADVDAGFRIICSEFEPDCDGSEKIKRTWYPISGMSLFGVSDNFAVSFNPINGIKGLFGMKALAFSLAAKHAASKAKDKIREKLKDKYGNLNDFATAICMATANLPAK
jgi:RHS repeat-associated protein